MTINQSRLGGTLEARRPLTAPAPAGPKADPDRMVRIDRRSRREVCAGARIGAWGRVVRKSASGYTLRRRLRDGATRR